MGQGGGGGGGGVWKCSEEEERKVCVFFAPPGSQIPYIAHSLRTGVIPNNFLCALFARLHDRRAWRGGGGGAQQVTLEQADSSTRTGGKIRGIFNIPIYTVPIY